MKPDLELWYGHPLEEGGVLSIESFRCEPVCVGIDFEVVVAKIGLLIDHFVFTRTQFGWEDVGVSGLFLK